MEKRKLTERQKLATWARYNDIVILYGKTVTIKAPGVTATAPHFEQARHIFINLFERKVK